MAALVPPSEDVLPSVVMILPADGAVPIGIPSTGCLTLALGPAPYHLVGFGNEGVLVLRLYIASRNGAIPKFISKL